LRTIFRKTAAFIHVRALLVNTCFCAVKCRTLLVSNTGQKLFLSPNWHKTCLQWLETSERLTASRNLREYASAAGQEKRCWRFDQRRYRRPRAGEPMRKAARSRGIALPAALVLKGTHHSRRQRKSILGRFKAIAGAFWILSPPQPPTAVRRRTCQSPTLLVSPTSQSLAQDPLTRQKQCLYCPSVRQQTVPGQMTPRPRVDIGVLKHQHSRSGVQHRPERWVRG